ncbi:MAG: urease accessory UreF family protein, partial [Actinomycetota bacterium]
TGGHAHSAGLESAVRIGEVVDLDTLARFAAARVATQGRIDAEFAAAAARAWASATRPNDGPEGDRAQATAIDELVAEYDARTLSPHLRAASRTLGRHLLRVAGSMLADPSELRARLRDAPRPIVAGAVAADVGLSPSYAAVVECHHLLSAVCAGAVKLLGLDPLAVVEVQTRLATDIDAIAASAAEPADVRDLAAATSMRAEVLAQWHAADNARLFAT